MISLNQMESEKTQIEQKIKEFENSKDLK